MFDQFLTTSRRTYTNASLNPKKKTPNSSMSKDKDNLIWRVSMHGLKKEDVKAIVKFNSPSLVINAEKDGILKVTLPKLKKVEIPNLNSDGEITLGSALAFCSSDLVLRFAAAFWLWVLLIEDSSCVLPREDSASFKTWLRFVSDLVAFCLEDFLRFVSRPPAFCLKTWMHFVSRPPAFCLKAYCVLSQGCCFCILASCVLSTIEDLFYVSVEGNAGKIFSITLTHFNQTKS
nr:hypothetical protein [Tanacetum cinerariifolium]